MGTLFLVDIASPGNALAIRLFSMYMYMYMYMYITLCDAVIILVFR